MDRQIHNVKAKKFNQVKKSSKMNQYMMIKFMIRKNCLPQKNKKLN